MDASLAERLRGFGPLGVAAIVVIVVAGNFAFVPVGALLVLFWVGWSETPWREIGYVRPKSWLLSAGLGIVGGIALKLLMKAVVMPLLGAEPMNGAYHYLAGNRAALPGAIAAMIFAAGFGEETVFRGFLFERLGKLLGRGPYAKAAIVFLAALTLGLLHAREQGLAGVEQATLVGLVLGGIVARTGSLFGVMCAHAAFDLAALWMIYCDVESDVAHWIFS
ncbi:MAG: CPBP family intramembrane glutamic endopeptidase [Acidobacteriota bacterium]